MTRCGAMPSLRSGDGDDVAVWGGQMIDWGRVCSQRHNALIDYENGK